MNYKILSLLLLAAGLLAGGESTAQAEQQQIEIVFDASRSMNDPVAGSQNSRLVEAKKALTTVAEQIMSEAHVGLRIFGKTPVQGNVKESCFDSKLEIPIQPYNKQAMLNEVVELAAHGQTALGYSLELAGQDFSPDPNIKKTVILISDGEESCGKDPINVIGALKARGINFVVHAIGFAVDPKTKAQLQQITNMTGGTYQDAQSGVQLKESLQKVAVQEKLVDPSAVQEEQTPPPAEKPKALPAKPALPEEETQKEMLLRAERGKAENLLSAVNGAKIISATSEDVAYAIDGSEESYAALEPGTAAVFSFKDNQPVLLEGFAIPVSEEEESNPKEILLSGSLENAQSGFFPLATAVFSNKVDFKDVYQTFKIDPPAAIRYLKVVTGETYGSSAGAHREWRALGKFLTEEEFKAKSASSAEKERNLIAKDAGGQLIAASGDGFEVLVDGLTHPNADYAAVEAGQEMILGFQDGKPAYITQFAIPIYEAADANCKTFEVFVSEDAPDSGYKSVGVFKTTNLLMAGKPMQYFKLPQPVKAKYVKIQILEDHGGAGYCYLTEVGVYGTFSAPATSNQAAQPAPIQPEASQPAPAPPAQPEPQAPAAVKTPEENAADFYNDFKTESAANPAKEDTV